MAQRVATERDRAVAFARLYVQLVEALQQQGCSEEVARSEARLAALVKLNESEKPHYDPALGPCPTCRRG